MGTNGTEISKEKFQKDQSLDLYLLKPSKQLGCLKWFYNI